MSSEYIVEVKDIVKDYANHRALDHVSLAVEKGKIHGLLGPNGAGKTTLIRILNQITAPDSGVVIFDGHPFTRSDLDSIGYLPEERGLYRKMKVGDQAIYLSRLKGLSLREAKRRLQVWFERMEIMPWWNKRVSELSKGMAQKVQFICTVIHEPKLLIFDEPFSGFDPINVEILKDEIFRLRENGHTLIFSTHNMQSVEDLCDNLTLINQSKVVLQGTVQSVRESYKGNIYKVIYDSTPTISDASSNHFTINSLISDEYGRTSLLLENNQSLTSNEIIQLCTQWGNIIYFEEVLPSMNEIFLDAVKKK